MIQVVNRLKQKVNILSNNLLPVLKLDISLFLNDIIGINYCITKYDTPYYNSKFPHEYTIGKDLDLLVHKDDFLSLIAIVCKHFEKQMKYFYKNKVIKDDNSIIIRIERFGILHYQIDISDKVKRVSKNCVNKMLNTRVKEKTFFIPQVKYELIIRLIEFLDNPYKKHHLEYIKKNKDYIDFELLRAENLLESYNQLFK
jgi:hypothetical protein